MIKTYRSTEVVDAIQWTGKNASEIENIVRNRAFGSVMRRGNDLLIDTAFADIALQVGDYLIIKGQLVWTYNEEKFARCYEILNANHE